MVPVLKVGNVEGVHKAGQPRSLELLAPELGKIETFEPFVSPDVVAAAGQAAQPARRLYDDELLHEVARRGAHQVAGEDELAAADPPEQGYLIRPEVREGSDAEEHLEYENSPTPIISPHAVSAAENHLRS